MTRDEMIDKGAEALRHRAAFMTYEEHDGHRAYYLAPVERTPPPYREQRHVTAIIDVASDGTFAGVELVMGDLPPALTAQPSEARDATYVLRQIVNAKEPPDSPTPDDADWQFVALEMKRIAALALSGSQATLAECPYDCENGCLLETTEFGPCLCVNPVASPSEARVTEAMVEAAQIELIAKMLAHFDGRVWEHLFPELQADFKCKARDIIEALSAALPSSTGWKP